jgi:hypothetical protein
MVTSDYTEKDPQFQPIIPVTGEPERLPLCEVCGDPHPKSVTILDHAPMMLCDVCQVLFGLAGGGDGRNQ